MNNIINQTYAFAKDFHSKDNSGHGFDHIERVYQNACKILQQESADDFIVQMSALLHDVDDRKVNRDGHAARDFMEKIKVPTETIERILETINAISFSKSGATPHFETLEQKILSDADKLDAMGTMGICRTIVYHANHNSPLFDKMVFPQSNLTLHEYKKNLNHAINHFFDKLLKLKGAMQTTTGEKEAEKRHQFMIKFLEQFFDEQNVPDWQDYLHDYLKKYDTKDTK